MIKKIRISAISYLNSLPFVYGIKKFGIFNGLPNGFGRTRSLCPKIDNR